MSYKRAAEAYQQILEEQNKENPLLSFNCGKAWKEACRYKEAI